jgi:hypothetical protein
MRENGQELLIATPATPRPEMVFDVVLVKDKWLPGFICLGVITGLGVGYLVVDNKASLWSEHTYTEALESLIESSENGASPTDKTEES